MTASPIAIRNVYMMMAYAFRSVQQGKSARFATEDFEHLHELLAEILIRGMESQIKKGLQKDYAVRRDELATVRGRINLSSTIAARSRTRSRLVCDFDEYVKDTPQNRALKSVLVLMYRSASLQTSRKKSIRRILEYLENVVLVAPSSIKWNALTVNRSNASYRLLLGVCKLVVLGLLPSKQVGETPLADWFTEEQMSRLYERFIREYFSFHHPELSPSGRIVPWGLDESNESSRQLPQMKTDLSLRSGTQILIIDAKYYKNSMQRYWGSSTLHSGHLYQILSYVKNEEVRNGDSVSGLLLYARSDGEFQPNLDVSIMGSRIGAQVLDLNCEWSEIRDQLENVLTWVGNG